MKPGDVIEYSCGIARVLDVNECRAKLLLLKGKNVQFTTLTGRAVSFSAKGKIDSISPAAEVKIIKRAEEE